MHKGSLSDKIYKTPQTRWKCPHCGTEGWYTPGSKGSHPLFDHNRSAGGRCQKAQLKTVEGVIKTK